MADLTTLYHTRARGKLLLTAEYAVLDGALALALPVRYGQTLTIQETSVPGLQWTAQAQHEDPWLTAHFSLPELALLNGSNLDAAETLQAIFKAIRAQRPHFLTEQLHLAVHTQTDFPRAWGLGTSSTLIAALCRWADADPYAVLEATMGGSGYDLACAYADGPILYQRRPDAAPLVTPVAFAPPFAAQLYFVFLGQKQNSREGIELYRQANFAKDQLVKALSALTNQVLQATTLSEFQTLLHEHERLLHEALQLSPVQTRLFPDFAGAVKSLGAWGGDFVLAASDLPAAAVRAYFAQKGCPTVLEWGQMFAP